MKMTADQRKGYWLGAFGVVLFSLTFPFTKLAVKELDATFVGLGRAIVAAIPAAALLIVTRQRLPRREHLVPLLLVAGGAVIGFPLLLAVALHRVHSSHAAIVAGLIPLGTAMLGSWRDGERQHPLFWLAAAIGSGVVLVYTLLTGGHAFSLSDLALFGAVVSAAVGYTEGARLGRSLGSWQVICWALVISAPVLLYPVVRSFELQTIHASAAAWAGFAYTGLVSMFLGYFIWYRGLMLGGIARVSQVQLIQPFLALAFSALMLGEELTPLAITCALLVFGCVAVTRRLAPRRIVLEEV